MRGVFNGGGRASGHNDQLGFDSSCVSRDDLGGLALSSDLIRRDEAALSQYRIRPREDALGFPSPFEPIGVSSGSDDVRVLLFIHTRSYVEKEKLSVARQYPGRGVKGVEISVGSIERNEYATLFVLWKS